MNKNKKRWKICQKCLNEKATKTGLGEILFAGITAMIGEYIKKKDSWSNPIRLVSQNEHIEELCSNCEYELEHNVIGQKKINKSG